jgi:hypothetical protein
MNSSSLRAAMIPVARQIRAYFAPFDRASNTPAIFDPGLSGAFPPATPPSPWVDLGGIENFARWYETSTSPVRSGARSVASVQFRGALEARVEFCFLQWGKLQMALACGAEHMNVLAPLSASNSPVPTGGTPSSASAILPGSTASELVFGPGVSDRFAQGDLIAVDVDYQQQVGYVGSGIAAAYVKDSSAVKHDPNYVRRVTFNVGRVAEVTNNSVVLTQPLLGGVPAAGAAEQVVVAFVDREGGSFFQEWSALFVAEEQSGGRVCFYYPRLSASVNASAAQPMRESFDQFAKPLSMISLRASFLALPYVDTNDGQTVLCYRSYFPAESAAVY